MKKIISLALVLVMAMVVLTACGETIIAPSGKYATESGTYTIEINSYDEKSATGTLTVTRTLFEVEDKVTGTFEVFVNGEPEDNSFVLDFTPDGGATIENCFGYLANDDAISQMADLDVIAGNGSSYYKVTEEEVPAAE